MDIGSKMKILFVGWANTANVPHTLVEAINRYTPHEAQFVQSTQTWLRYPISIMEHTLTDVDFRQMVREADVIHMDVMFPGCKPELSFVGEGKHIQPEWLMGKKVIRHGHGTVTRQYAPQIAAVSSKYNITNIVSTPDLIPLLPDAQWLPNPLDLENPLYAYHEPDMDNLKIVHAPTNSWVKSTNHFESVVKELQKTHPVQYVPVSRLPHKDCMSLRQGCTFLYDQYKLQAYGVSAIEQLAVGGIVFCGFKDYLHYYQQMGDLPLVDVDQDTLQDVMEEWFIRAEDEPEEVLQHIGRGRAWVEEYHDARVVVQQLMDIYENALPFGESQMSEKGLLSVGIIAQNEARGIANALSSVKDGIDQAVVLVDDKTVDNTLEVASETVKEHGCYAYTVQNYKWEDDFSKARNQYLEMSNTTWCLTLDGHEYLPEGHIQKLREFLPTVPSDTHVVNLTLVHDDGTRSLQPRVQRVGKSEYRNAAHNVVYPYGGLELPEVEIIHSRDDWQSDESRSIRNSQRGPHLKKALGDKKDSRSIFYLARQYFDEGNWEEASRLYIKYFDAGGWPEERWWARCLLAWCYRCMGRMDDAEEQYNLADKEMKRAEHWYAMARLAYHQLQDRDKALLYFRKASQEAKRYKTIKKTAVLHFEEEPYGWAVPDYLSMCLREDTAVALKYARKAMSLNPPDREKPRIRDNIRQWEERLGTQEEEERNLDDVLDALKAKGAIKVIDGRACLVVPLDDLL